jgi:hypothetical protein
VPDATAPMVVGGVMSTATDGLPEMIPFGKIEDVLTAIGLDARDCISLTFGIDGVTIKRARTTTDGKSLGVGNDLATITTVIGYDRPRH